MPPLSLINDKLGAPCMKGESMVNKTYKVTARIMIQDGKSSHIVRYKDEMEHMGSIGDTDLARKVLRGFDADLVAEASQTVLAVDEKPSTEPKKITGKEKEKKP